MLDKQEKIYDEIENKINDYDNNLKIIININILTKLKQKISLLNDKINSIKNKSKYINEFLNSNEYKNNLNIINNTYQTLNNLNNKIIN